MKHEFEYNEVEYYDPVKGLPSCMFKCKRCGKEKIFNSLTGEPWEPYDLNDCDEHMIKSIMEK